MTDDDQTPEGRAEITTYHCLCSQLLGGTRLPIETMPKRQLDNSFIAIPGDFGKSPLATISTQDLLVDSVPTVLRLDDGFEKRYAARCGRCGLMTGYYLDRSQLDNAETGVNEDVLYILPDSLEATDKIRQST
ncbi:hypothetical protein B0A48_09153 [Cryoendolithus antarcticus]|uniref:STEEP1 domain-containing protein n=1 Tax=Cryoendolithus antarcticus TaxID=1507870 RepID=A0A1V8T1T1_9PEZI|nr:hypothetical protein B0A48_09153 [Cryoendolithus antarcticus]